MKAIRVLLIVLLILGLAAGLRFLGDVVVLALAIGLIFFFLMRDFTSRKSGG